MQNEFGQNHSLIYKSKINNGISFKWGNREKIKQLLTPGSQGQIQNVLRSLEDKKGSFVQAEE